MTSQLQEVKRVLFSSKKATLTIQNVDTKVGASYRLTRSDSSIPAKIFVWGKDKGASSNQYIGMLFPHTSKIAGLSIPETSTVYTLLKYFVMMLFDEYPQMRNMGVSISAECVCCGNYKTIIIEGEQSEKK